MSAGDLVTQHVKVSARSKQALRHGVLSVLHLENKVNADAINLLNVKEGGLKRRMTT